VDSTEFVNGTAGNQTVSGRQVAYFPEGEDDPYWGEDIVVSCIEERAMALQGHIPRENLERLQVVRSEAPLTLF
jgi:hypothetical protein